MLSFDILPWYVWIILIVVAICFILRFCFGRVERSAPRNIKDDLAYLDELSIQRQRKYHRFQKQEPDGREEPQESEIPIDLESQKIPIEQESEEESEEKSEEQSDSEEEFDIDHFYRCNHPYIANESKGEKACRKFLKKYFGLPFKSCKPHYLRNPESPACLEYDCYEGSLRLAVEYQGKQHYEYVPFFHRNGISDFYEQQRKDELKVLLSEKVRVWLIRVPYTTPDEDIGEYITERLPLHLKKK